jgi:dolichol kinase
MFLVGLLCSPALYVMKQSSMEYSSRNRYIGVSVLFSVSFTLIVVGILEPVLHNLIGYEPFLWTLNYITDFNSNRPSMIVYWIVVITIAVYLASKWVGTKQQTSAQIDLKRKYFHILVILLFVPGYRLDVGLLNLGLSVAFACFVFLEYLRCFRFFFIWSHIDQFFTPFLDERDQSGSVILSHIYLLLGCALPIWLNKFISLT